MPHQHTIAALQKAIAEADALAAQKSNFLATMSHEIRTPMQTIFGLLELIGQEKPDDKIMSMVNTAQDAASGLLEILDDILDIAKMDADAMELDMFEVPVRLLVRGLLEGLAVRVRHESVALYDDIGDDVPFVIKGDPKRLRQILMNLCGNALKFTESGHVKVSVTTQVHHISPTPNGVSLRFEVEDTGIGIAEDSCARLFTSFTQADSSTSRQYGGTGLGLSISKKLVTLMGGQIGVDSIAGQGSIFWFEIPTEAVCTDQTTVTLPDLSGISVLSVEDHPQGAKEIVSSLRSMGATVDHCTTYHEGLALAQRHPFDVAVIDQGLPDGVGLDLIHEIQHHRPQTGLIMYTVRDDVGLSHSLSAVGATYLTKPASRAGLGEAVQHAAIKTAGVIDGAHKVLLAEDTASIRDILGRQLSALGVEADFAKDGAEALSMMGAEDYGLIITDLHMPVLDGYGVVKAIREGETPDAGKRPVILLTADVQMAQRDAYSAYGFDECLLKPVTLGHLRRLLIRWRILNTAENDTATPPAQTAHAPQDDTPAIDTACLLANMGALDDNAIAMMHMFIDMTQPLMHQIRDAHDKGDFHALSELGHSLKGAARSACCTVLGDYAATLQDDAASEAACDQHVQDIAVEFKRVQHAVNKLSTA